MGGKTEVHSCNTVMTHPVMPRRKTSIRYVINTCLGTGQSGMTSWITYTPAAGKLKSGELETTPPSTVRRGCVTLLARQL